MARPPNADSATTFEAIRAAALELLEAGGADAISVRRVAEKAGVAMGTLRYYFPSREDLIEACLDLYHDNLLALQGQLVLQLRQAEDPREATARVTRAVFRMLAAQPHVHHLRILTSIRQRGLPEERRRRVRAPFLSDIAGVLAELSQAPEERLRLVVDAVMRLVSWYAASTPEELMDLTGTATHEEALSAIEDHVASTAVRLIFSPQS